MVLNFFLTERGPTQPYQLGSVTFKFGPNEPWENKMAQTPFKTTKDQSINKVWVLNLKKKNGNHRNKHIKMMHTSNLGVHASKVWGLNLQKKIHIMGCWVLFRGWKTEKMVATVRERGWLGPFYQIGGFLKLQRWWLPRLKR